MSNSIDFLLTNAASELISKVLDGKTLNFTRMAVGDGFSYDTNVAKGFKNVVNEVLSLDITKKETLSPSSIKITSAFKNTDAQKEFYYREVGLYAQDPDTGEEVLYAYGNRNDAAELITPAGSNIVTKQLIFIISVGDSANVTFNVNADVYALQDDMLDVQADIENLQSNKANKNLNNTGMITNCLLEVPQNIKLELSDGTLTLKAGSKVYYPNGFEADGTTLKFDELIINKDLTSFYNRTSDTWILYVDSNGYMNIRETNLCYSGIAAPTVKVNNQWYNTALNSIGSSDSAGTNYIYGQSLPIAIVTTDATGFASIKQIFNSMGYMGSTIFVLPGVKGLIPNGKNEDGTLDNIEYTIDRVRITGPTGTYNRYLLYENGIITGAVNYYEQTDPPTIGEEFERWFDTKNNLSYFHEAGGISWRLGNFSILGKFSTYNGTITTLEPKRVFRAVDYSDFEVQKKNTLRTSHITNCITEIPQDIILKLSAGTLTLKAGSKVYIPNGFESDGTTLKFDELIVKYDISLSDTSGLANGKQGLFYIDTDNAVHYYDLSIVFSGSTAPTTYSMWYDTTNNKILETRDAGITWKNQGCLPLCIFTSNGTGIASIDQIFNGFSYIDSVTFILPGVRGLIPNGLNNDGTLKNIEHTVSKVIVNEWGTEGYTGSVEYVITNDDTIDNSGVGFYVSKSNYLINNTFGGVSKGFVFAEGKRTNGVVTSFNPHQPFQAVNKSSDKSWLSGLSMPSEKYIDLEIGESGITYIAPANGYFVARCISTNEGYFILYNTTTGIHEERQPGYLGAAVTPRLEVRKGDVVQIEYSLDLSDTKILRFYYAQGEVE